MTRLPPVHLLPKATAKGLSLRLLVRNRRLCLKMNLQTTAIASSVCLGPLPRQIVKSHTDMPCSSQLSSLFRFHQFILSTPRQVTHDPFEFIIHPFNSSMGLTLDTLDFILSFFRLFDRSRMTFPSSFFYLSNSPMGHACTCIVMQRHQYGTRHSFRGFDPALRPIALAFLHSSSFNLRMMEARLVAVARVFTHISNV